MAVLGWIALGLATAVVATGFRGSGETRRLLAGRYAVGMLGALLGGLIAVAAGVGPIGDFFDAGTWVIALAGAVAALVVYELASTSRGPRDPARPTRSGAVRKAGGESERLNRNW